MSQTERGYSGKILLVSPSGDQQEVILPGRWKDYRGVQTYYGGGGKKAVKDFHRLLSSGWKIVRNGEKIQSEEEGQVGEKEKKNTDLVIGTTQTGNASHGGNHASCEVKDSPNKAQRGCRGGTKKSHDNNSRRSGGRGVYCPQPLRVSKEQQESAKDSAELLSKLIGGAQNKTRQGVTTDAYRLLVALETGDDPLPALEAPRERPRLRVIVTPDCSGSCQSWSGLGRAWAKAIAEMPEVDSIYAENFNGQFRLETTQEEGRPVSEKSAESLVKKADILIYLGDGDGYGLCSKYALMGAIVVAFDCYCSSQASPRLDAPKGQANLYWVSHVSAKAPQTWYEGLRLVLGS